MDNLQPVYQAFHHSSYFQASVHCLADGESEGMGDVEIERDVGTAAERVKDIAAVQDVQTSEIAAAEEEADPTSDLGLDSRRVRLVEHQ